jgi:hypothetical protein
MATDNATIIDDIRLAGTNDFQQRIPSATQAGVTQVMKHLFDPMNGRYLNDFMWNLVNRIGLTVMAQNSFENPLNIFKKENLFWGSTVQENAVRWIKAQGYTDDATDLLKLHRPEGASWYHTQNRKDQYEISWVYDEARSAFTDEYGLNQLMARIMRTPANSDNNDELQIMLMLIAFYEKYLGFYKVHLDNVPSDETTAKTLLKAIRSQAGYMRFPSTQYNALNVPDIPAFADPSDMVLFITPDYNASLDVDALAAAFQISKAEVPYRVIEVPSFYIPGAVALLVSREWYQCRDTLYNVTNFYNGQQLSDTYYLNHWGIYGVSPFTPCALFTTDAGTSITVVTQTVTGWTMTADNTTASSGDLVQLTGKLAGSIAPTGTAVELLPNSATYEIAARHADTTSGDPAVTTPGKPFALNINTFVDNRDRLHIQRDKLKTGDIITVTGTATYVNPNGETADYSDSVDITIA